MPKKITTLLQKVKSLGGIKSPFPGFIKPMLATKTEKPFNNPDFIYEVKWDGYRIISAKNKSTVDLRTRKAQNYTSVYSSITDALKKLPYSFVMDGEVIYTDEEGNPSFDDLQNVRSLGTDNLVYNVFDLLWIEGYSLLEVPLINRKEILKMILLNTTNVVYSDHIEEKGLELFDEMLKADMEGIMAKEANGIYIPGQRTRGWLKMQTKIRQEFVIGGWTETDSGRSFKSLLFGYYNDNGELICYGHGGGGYTDVAAAQIMKKLKGLEQKKTPFSNEVETDSTPHWVKPQLVAEFEFATTTKSGKIRKPAIFKGLRTDKIAKDVHLDKPVRIGKETVAITKKEVTKKEVTNEDSNWPKIKKLLGSGSKNTIVVDKHKVVINDIERELWPGVTKGDLLNYYVTVADYLLPYLKDRPLSLYIKHEGVYKQGLFQKAMEQNQPSWATTCVIDRKGKKQGKSDKIDYLLCQNKATLLYLINLGCIDINPLNITCDNQENPSYFVIDLDPSGTNFELVITTAETAHTILEDLNIKAFAKTSGKTGMHIFIPVQPVFSFSQARSIVGLFCKLIHEKIPRITTIDDSVDNRGKKVFIDDNQNDRADTLAAVYSVRPAHQPTVSTPLEWKEIKKGLNPSAFTIKSVLKRLEQKGDLFKDILDLKIQKANTSIIKKILDNFPF